MAQFRKKPVVIDAFHLTEETRISNENWPDWMHQAWNEPAGAPGALMAGPDGPSLTLGHLYISTPEGVMEASFGDWIIRGVKGELYPCKPDIFAATYDPVPG